MPAKMNKLVISNVFITVIPGSNNQNKGAEAQLESFW